MGKIAGYVIDNNVTLGDMLIGTDIDNLNETKNYTVWGLLNLISTQLSSVYVPYTGATGNVDLGGNDLSVNQITAANGITCLAGNILGYGQIESVGTLIGQGLITGQFVSATNGMDVGVGPLFANATAGLSGQILQSQGPGVSPQWVNLAGNVNQSVQVLFKLVYNNAGGGQPYYDITPTVVYSSGVDVENPLNFTATFGKNSAVPNVSTDACLIYFKNFLLAQKDYIASANVMSFHGSFGNVNNFINKQVEAEIYWFNDASAVGDIRVRLYNILTGVPLQLVDLWTLTASGTKDVYVSLNINIAP